MESTDKEVEVKKNIINKIKVSKEQREKIYVKIFKEFGIAILIFIYFFFLNLGYVRIESNIFKEDLHTFAGILVISSILLFESAYRKDSDDIAIHGVELLIVAILTLFMPYIYFYRGVSFKFLYSISPIYIAFYFLIKSFIIYNIEVRKYRDSLSDVKEILTNKEKSYLDEENIKKFDEIKLESQERVKKANTKKKMAKMINDNRKRVRNDKDKNIKENDQKKNESKEKVEAKGTSFKKSTVGKSPNESAEEKVVKKTFTKTKKTTMTTTKKRGRPRKNTKKDVKPLATAGRTKKKDGDSKND